MDFKSRLGQWVGLTILLINSVNVHAQNVAETVPPLEPGDYIELTARALVPLEVDTALNSDGLQVSLMPQQAMPDVSHITYTGLAADGTEVFQKTNWWNNRLEANVRYDFRYQVQFPLEDLMVRVYGAEASLLAQTQAQVRADRFAGFALPTVAMKAVDLDLSSDSAQLVANLALERAGRTVGDMAELVVETPTERLSYSQPVAYDGRAGTVNFNLDDLTVEPGLYEYWLTIYNAAEEPVSGTYRGRELVDGNYAVIKQVEILTDSLRLAGQSNLVGRDLQAVVFSASGETLFSEPVLVTPMGEFELEWSLMDMPAESAGIRLQGDGRELSDFSLLGYSDYWLVASEPAINSRAVTEITNLNVSPAEPRSLWVGFSLVFWLVALVTVALFVVVLKWLLGGGGKRQFLWYLALGSLSALAVQTSQAATPIVNWQHPIPDPVLGFSTNNTSDFRYLRVQGEVYDSATYAGFFDGSVAPGQMSVQFQQGADVVRYLVNNIKADGSDINLGEDAYEAEYDFLVDLAKTGLGEGEWQMQVFMRKGPNTYGTPLTDLSGDSIGRINIDQTAPSIVFGLYNSFGDALEPDEVVDTPIELKVGCYDGWGVGCKPGGPGSGPLLGSVEVRGNFCAEAEVCNISGTREYEICDLVGNCQTESVEIKQYDPIAPNIDSVRMGFEAYFGNALRANEDYELELRYADANRARVTGASYDYNGTEIGLTAAEYDVLFDDHACGDGTVFEHTGTQCVLQRRACVLPGDYSARGEFDAAGDCVPTCPSGYTFEAAENACVQDCEFRQFDPVYMCFPFEVHTP